MKIKDFLISKNISEIGFNLFPVDLRRQLANEIDSGNALLFQPFKYRFYWVLFSAFFGTVWLYMSNVSGYGEPYDPNSMHSLHETWVYVVPISMVLIPIWICYRNFIRNSKLPWVAGTYLFPSNLVDARTENLRIIPISEIVDVEVNHKEDSNGSYSHTTLTFRFDGGYKVTFHHDDPDYIVKCMEFLVIHQDSINEAEANGDDKALAVVDPFREAREKAMEISRESDRQAFVEFPSLEGPHIAPVPIYFKNAGKMLGMIVIVFWLAGWQIRDRWSDERVFKQLKEVNTSDGWRWYLQQGGRNSGEVKAKWLVEAALKEALNQGGLFALQEFEKEFHGDEYQVYRARASKEIPEAALKLVINDETVTALRQFKSEFHEARFETYRKEADLEIHSLFEKALSDFKQQASGEDPRLIPFFARLFAWIEKNDAPDVYVVFDPPDEKSIKRLDEVAEADHNGKFYFYSKVYPKIPIAPAFEHFKPSVTARKEQTITQLLNNSFSSIIPQDILNLKKSSENMQLNAPLIRVNYSILPVRDSGSVVIYHDIPLPIDGGRGHIGVKFSFVVTMIIPGDPKRFDFPIVVGPPKEFSVRDSSFGSSGGTQDEKVYNSMSLEAFENLADEMRRVLFKEGTEGFEAASLPERRMLKIVLAHLILMRPEGKTNPSEAVRVFNELTGEAITESVIQAEVNRTIKFVEENRDKERLRSISENLKNEFSKKVVVMGAFYFITNTDDEIDAEVKGFFNDLLRVLDVSDEQFKKFTGG